MNREQIDAIKARARVDGYDGVGEMIHRHNMSVLNLCSGCYVVGREILDALDIDALVSALEETIAENERLRASVQAFEDNVRDYFTAIVGGHRQGAAMDVLKEMAAVGVRSTEAANTKEPG